MLRISLLELIVRGIFEELFFVLSVHAFSKTGINLKRFLLSGMIFWISQYFIRCLPIQYGIHSILSLIALIILGNLINKIDIIKSIRAGIITFILGFIFEGMNLCFIQFILKKDLNMVMNNPNLKILYGIPSVIVLGIFVIAYYLILLKRKELKYV